MSAAAPSLFDVRRSGVLLHPTSLPGPHGCGDFGAEAYHFVDWLRTAGQTIWQVLPLHPVGAGNSPYQSVSVFAGNPLLVDLAPLVERGWLGHSAPHDFERTRVDYARVAPARMALLREAWNGFVETARDEDEEQLADFREQQAHWLDDYALFMALHERHGGPWTRWPAEYALRDQAALERLRAEAGRCEGTGRARPTKGGLRVEPLEPGDEQAGGEGVAGRRAVDRVDPGWLRARDLLPVLLQHRALGTERHGDDPVAAAQHLEGDGARELQRRRAVRHPAEELLDAVRRRLEVLLGKLQLRLQEGGLHASRNDLLHRLELLKGPSLWKRGCHHHEA